MTVKFIYSAILVLLCLSLCAQPSMPANKEIWIELGLTKCFNRHLSIGLLANSFNQINAEFNNYDNFIEGSVKFQVNKAISVEGLYRQEYSRNESNSKEIERRPQVRGVYSFNLRNWSFRSRHRYEWRFFDNLKMKTRYRTDFRVKPPLKFSSLNFTPYLQPELFFSQRSVNRSRCYLGFIGQLKNVFPSLYVMWQSDNKSTRWEQKYAMGFACDFIL